MWQTRRVVWSKEIIYFARIGETAFFDSIPLAEVRGIDKVDQAPAVGSSAPSARLRKTRSVGEIPHSAAPIKETDTAHHRNDLDARTFPAAGAKPPTTAAPPPDDRDAEAAARGPARTRIVEVRAAAARNLPKMDAFGTCDAFCRLSLCGETRETSVSGRG
jgi:hypothetical protein